MQYAPPRPVNVICSFAPNPAYWAKGKTGSPRGKPHRSAAKAVTMVRLCVALVALLGLVACGGSRSPRAQAFDQVQFASGPIQKACQAQGRKQASRARCGCVQAVANRELSASDQRRGAKYFKDPHALQQVRQNQDSNAGNKRFWAVWKAYGQRAAQVCSGV